MCCMITTDIERESESERETESESLCVQVLKAISLRDVLDDLPEVLSTT